MSRQKDNILEAKNLSSSSMSKKWIRRTESARVHSFIARARLTEWRVFQSSYERYNLAAHNSLSLSLLLALSFQCVRTNWTELAPTFPMREREGTNTFYWDRDREREETSSLFLAAPPTTTLVRSFDDEPVFGKPID